MDAAEEMPSVHSLDNLVLEADACAQAASQVQDAFRQAQPHIDPELEHALRRWLDTVLTGLRRCEQQSDVSIAEDAIAVAAQQWERVRTLVQNRTGVVP